jgi:hypothetical protein
MQLQLQLPVALINQQHVCAHVIVESHQLNNYRLSAPAFSQSHHLQAGTTLFVSELQIAL